MELFLHWDCGFRTWKKGHVQKKRLANTTAHDDRRRLDFVTCDALNGGALCCDAVLGLARQRDGAIMFGADREHTRSR